MEQTDERLRQELEDENPRAPRAGSASRRSREADDRAVTERRDLSDEDRLQMFRQTLFNDVLPDLPPIAGFHVCWLSTTHPSDTIPHRMRLGYTPVTPEEAFGMDHATLKTGEYSGCIGINEMVAFKLPMNLYLGFMQEAHHESPARDEAMIVTQADQLRKQAQQDGADLIEEDGLAGLRRSAPLRGKFSD